MPYKDLEMRKAVIKAWKDKNREKIRKKNLAYYYDTRPPLKPRFVRTEEELKAQKAQHDKTYRAKHKEKLRLAKAKYYQDNKAKIVKRYLENLRTNLATRIAHNLRNRTRAAIRQKSKGGSAVRDLGCSIPEFQEYVSKKFTEGMRWDNYGQWHLDHIIPLCEFDLSKEEEFKRASHYTNYQPLWAKDNLTKNRFTIHSLHT